MSEKWFGTSFVLGKRLGYTDDVAGSVAGSRSREMLLDA